MHDGVFDPDGESMPGIPVPDDVDLESCDDDRESLTPKETADCAGADLVREYDNEEDGGS